MKSTSQLLITILVGASLIQSAVCGEPNLAPVHDVDNSLTTSVEPCSECQADSCDGICQVGLWTSWEFLIAWRSRTDTPPLVTTSPNSGVLPQATILLGDESLGGEGRPAGRLTVGGWLDTSYCWAIEGRMLFLADQSITFDDDSNNNGTLGRPFINLTPLGGSIVGDDAFLISSPGTATGTVDVLFDSDVVLGDVTFRRLLYDGPGTEVDLLGGYAMSRIDESLLIQTSSQLVTGTSLDVFDRFDTANEFHAGHFGLLVDSYNGCWSLKLRGQVALGSMQQSVSIRGRQTSTAIGQNPVVTDGGLYAQPTNIGDYQRSRFVVSPEFDLSFGYHVNDHVELTAGYMFVYWTRVAQAGNQIDPTLNPNQPPPNNEPQRPAFGFQEDGYYVHGLTFGLNANF